jgi:hypothetical protein
VSNQLIDKPIGIKNPPRRAAANSNVARSSNVAQGPKVAPDPYVERSNAVSISFDPACDIIKTDETRTRVYELVYTPGEGKRITQVIFRDSSDKAVVTVDIPAEWDGFAVGLLEGEG